MGIERRGCVGRMKLERLYTALAWLGLGVAIGAFFVLSASVLSSQQSSEPIPGYFVSPSTFTPGGARCNEEHLKSAPQRQRDVCAYEADAHAREQSGLRQQWRAANAAERAIQIAQSQTTISLIESLLLLLTLLATAIAAWAAATASKSAQLAVGVAERDLVERDRPELIVAAKSDTIREGFDGREQSPYVEFSVKNVGGRKATVTFCDVEFFFVTGDPPVPGASIFEVKAGDRHVELEPRGKGTTTGAVANDFGAIRASLVSRERTMFVVGYIEFEDGVGGKWEHGFCYSYWIWTMHNSDSHEVSGVGGTLMRWPSPGHNFDRARRSDAAQRR